MILSLERVFCQRQIFSPMFCWKNSIMKSIYLRSCATCQPLKIKGFFLKPQLPLRPEVQISKHSTDHEMEPSSHRGFCQQKNRTTQLWISRKIRPLKPKRIGRFFTLFANPNIPPRDLFSTRDVIGVHPGVFYASKESPTTTVGWFRNPKQPQLWM